LKKWFVSIVVVLALFTSGTEVFAKNSNPPADEIKRIITEKALQYNIPPEVLKAIAFVENGYKQFNAQGDPYIASDGGIGVMQVTPEKIDQPVNVERLKFDIEYNIEVAAQVLDSKWKLSYLPKMNEGDRHVLENWYFPIMAYNGLSKVNDPNINPNTAYQEKVFDRIKGASLIYWTQDYFDFPVFDLRYEKGNDTMKFPEGVVYQTATKTSSLQMYKKGDLVNIDGRDGSIWLRDDLEGTPTSKLWPYTPVKISGEPVESPKINNDFVYYKVKGVSANGFVASSYLNKADKAYTFSDPYTDERAAALYYLAENDYVKGYPDGSFGSNKSLKREHVAVILDKMLNMKKPAGYKMKAKDVKADNPYYEQLAKAEYNGYLGHGGTLRPKSYLTRSQMASVLVKALDQHYKEPTIKYSFKDQRAIWNYDAVNKLYYNKVTIANPFRPEDDITRSQFALFIYKTMVAE